LDFQFRCAGAARFYVAFLCVLSSEVGAVSGDSHSFDSVASVSDSLSSPDTVQHVCFDSAALPADSNRQDQTFQNEVDTTAPYTIVVTAKRFTKYTPSQRVLEAKDFSGKYQDLQSVLETVSGVSVRDMGGFGHYAEAAIRGSSPNQVQVYLDGIALNGSTGNAVDISKIPLSTLQKITVYKNTPSIEFFGDNAGGVINLTTTTVREAQAASLEIGSFGYRAGNAMIDKKIGRMTHRFSVNYGYADNDYPYINDRGTTLGPAARDDDTAETMDNNFFSIFSSQYANVWEINDRNKLTSQLSAMVTDEGIFYFPQADSNDGSIKNSKLALIETYETAVDSALAFTFRLKLKTEDELFQRFTPFYLYPPPVRIRHETRQPYAGIEGIVKGKNGDHFSFTGIVSGSYNGFNFKDLYLQGDVTRPYFFRLSGKIGAEAGITLRENLIARLGGLYRYEVDFSNGKFYYSGFVPGGQRTNEGFPCGFSEVAYEPLDDLNLLASVRYSSRSPGFSEKFSMGANYAGNSDLRPETRLEYDIGFAVNKPPIALSASFFTSDTKNKIIFTMNSQHMFVPQNMNEVAAWGVESDLTVAPVDWFVLTNSATYMENIIRSSAVTYWVGNDEPLQSRFSDELGIKFTYKKIYAGHSARVVSPYFLGPDNIAKISHNKPELNASIGIVPDKHFDCSYRLENYMNVQDYDFPDRPIPGIRHYVVVKCNF
jgi:outer membrane cobalamin receptor